MGKGLIGSWQLLNAILIAHGLAQLNSNASVSVKAIDQTLAKTGYFFSRRVIRNNLRYHEKAHLTVKRGSEWGLTAEGFAAWARGAYLRESSEGTRRLLDRQERGE